MTLSDELVVSNAGRRKPAAASSASSYLRIVPGQACRQHVHVEQHA